MNGPAVGDTAAAMIDAAQDLLDGLDEQQRQRATWPFPSDEERRRWFYTPTDHGGLALAEMSGRQHRLVYRLLASGLSEAGFNTTAVIIGQENLLDRLEGFGVDFGRERGRDPLLYWVAVFGRPGPDGAWGWRFGGHHVSLHFTMVDGAISSTTPCFLGADPASSPLLGPHPHRPLAGAEDLGRQLVRALDPGQARRAVVAPAPPTDLVSSNRTKLHDGDRPLALPLIWRGRFEASLDRQLGRADAATADALGLEPQHLDDLAFTVRPKGLSAADMAPELQEMLRALLAVYVGRIHDDLADAEMAKFSGQGLDDLRFLWAGGLEPGDAHYYRIQGPDLLVEYDNAQRGGNHIHTVWRDLSNDFGDALAHHYTTGQYTSGHGSDH